VRRLAAVAVAGACLLGAAPAGAVDVLPDLDQIVPTDISVRGKLVSGGRRVFRLGFGSASANVGPGDLTIHGYRPDRRVNRMRVDQLVDQSEGPARLLRDVGEMAFIVHPDHRHWHFLGFERYQLRHGGQLVRTDRKTGFCLGDRYAIPQAPTLEGFNPTPLQGDTCGLAQPSLVSLFAGISTGWADRYEPHIEGQHIDITGLRAGTYVLTHVVNLNRTILESDYSNNASSVRLTLRWPDGPRVSPRMRILKRCPATPTC
jgi:hypothetical protein